MQNTYSKHNSIESQGQNSTKFSKLQHDPKKSLIKSCLKKSIY